LSVEVVKIGVRSRSEEGVARVANGTLDASLLVAARARRGAAGSGSAPADLAVFLRNVR
jgi:hypothetical protein